MIFRPKNPYKHRPLPYLIGSKGWHEKWHIGLVEEDSDQSDNDNNDDDDAEEEEGIIQYFVIVFYGIISHIQCIAFWYILCSAFIIITGHISIE